ncbi:MAG: C1 family peptidase [Cyanobacteriota bacterium]|nr:C1 family peptidase [Cyanobacteriota bacterium]
MFKKILATVTGIVLAAASVSAINVDFCFGWNVQKCDQITNPSIPLMNMGTVNVACDNCYFETKGTLDFDIHPLEKNLKVGFENLEIDFVGEIDASASGQWSFDKNESPTVFQATLIDTHIGILPVHVWLEVPISVDLQGQFSGNADGKIGITVKGNIGNWETEYNHGWKHIYPNPTFDITHTLDTTIQAEGAASLKIQPQILLHVDNIFEGGITMNQLASIDIQMTEGGALGVAENSELECSLCEWIAGEAEQLLASNYTLEKMETFLDNLCNNLGQKLSPLCTSLVQEYLPLIIEFIGSELSPQQICQKISLCPSGSDVQEDCCWNGNCCHGMEYCCTDCSGSCVCSVNGKCQNTKNTFGKSLLETETKILPHIQSIQSVNVCEKMEKRLETIHENVRRDPRLAMEISGKNIQNFRSRALANNCINLIEKIDILANELRRDREIMNGRQLQSLKGSPLECTVCTFLVQEAEQLLLSKYTLTQVETIMKDACQKLGALTEICDTVVQQYLPIILQFLESKAQPSIICQKLGLCTSEITLEAPEFKVCVKATENLNIDWQGELKLDWFHYDKQFDVKLVNYVKSLPFGNCGSGIISESGSNYTRIDDMIRQINANISAGWNATHNQFSTLTREEIQSRLMNRIFHSEVKTVLEPELRGPVPDSFDSRQKWGSCIHPVRDQMQCGSCWAFSASEVASDRLCIASQTDVILSPEYILECDHLDKGCQGGELNTVWNFLTNTGTVSDACQPYTSGTGVVGKCPKTCIDSSQPVMYKAKSNKAVGKKDMQMEIMTNGPIQGAFSVYQDFMHYKTGVYSHTTGSLLGGHAIEIVGWGVSSDNVPYWICKNSWNTAWGQQGYFWIKRGTDECGIESNAYTGYF